MILYWPQVTYLLLLIAGFAVMVRVHGQPKTGKHSVFIWLTAVTFTNILLYFGGFWTGGMK